MDIDAVVPIHGQPGWLEFRLRGDEAPRLLVKVERRGERAVPVRVILDGEMGARTARAIPWGRFEAIAHRFGVAAAAESTPTEALEIFTEFGRAYPDQFKQIDDSLDHYLRESHDQLQSYPRLTKISGRRDPLTRPDGTDPERFYTLVAEAYREALAGSAKPAKALAEEAKVPVGTVHRWVREARRQGFLPPARQGRAG